MRRTTLVLAVAIASFPSTILAVQSAHTPQSAATQPVPVPPPASAESSAAQISPVMLLDRIAQLEASVRAADKRLDDARNLIYTLFGGLVAILVAIGIPIIFRERREIRDLRERASLEREKIRVQLEHARSELEGQIVIVRNNFNSETNTLRQGLVESLRAQMLAMQHDVELSISTQRAQLLDTTPPELAQLAMQRLEAQLEKYTQTLKGLNAPILAIDYLLRAKFYLGQASDQGAAAAAAEARRALEIEPENADALIVLSQALSILGESDEAMSHLRHAREIAPTDDRVVAALVVTALRSERHEEALKWSQLLQQRSDFANQAWLATAQATSLRRLGRIREAIQVLSQLLGGQPRLSQVRADLIEAQLDAELFDQAERLASEGLALNPSDLQLAVLRARARAGAGRYDEALQDLAMAERGNPRDVKIYLTKARVHAGRAQYSEAIAACHAGLALHGPEALHALLYLSLAQALVRLQQVTEAVRASEEAVRLGQAHVLNHLVLVQCLFSANRLAEAVLAANEALKISKSAWATALLHLFLALSLYGIHGVTPVAQKAEDAFKGVMEDLEIKWDFPFIQSCIEARTDDPDVRDRMLALVHFVSGVA
jgi:tetratricopeptide (TPR) repeat protein